MVFNPHIPVSCAHQGEDRVSIQVRARHGPPAGTLQALAWSDALEPAAGLCLTEVFALSFREISNSS